MPNFYGRAACAAGTVVLVGFTVRNACCAIGALPGAVRQPLPKSGLVTMGSRASNHSEAMAVEQVSGDRWYREWREVCGWIRHHTPPDSIVLTPRRQQTFKWYAQRAEVASWKDIPQDAQSIVAWHRALENIYSREGTRGRGGPETLSDYELVSLARRHRASYVVIESASPNQARLLKRCYPSSNSGSRLFEVYKIDR
jgi:hypothetical protein